MTHFITIFALDNKPYVINKTCRFCLKYPYTVSTTKLYTRREIFMMQISIDDFHTSFYIPAIKKLSFHLTNVRIIGTNNCGNTCHEAFKRHISNHYLLCCRNYSERVVASFEHQILSEYYSRNRSVSIEGITLEHCSAPTHTETAAILPVLIPELPKL